jgi:hypothetical protein
MGLSFNKEQGCKIFRQECALHNTASRRRSIRVYAILIATSVNSLYGLQQKCRKIIVIKVKHLPATGNAHTTVTRCNSHGNKQDIFVLSSSMKKKVALSQLSL